MKYEILDDEIKDIIPLNKDKFDSLDENITEYFLQLAGQIRFKNTLLNKSALLEYKYIFDDIKKTIPIIKCKLLKKHFDIALFQVTSGNKDYILKIYDNINDNIFKERMDNSLYCAYILENNCDIPNPKIILYGENYIVMNKIDGITLLKYYKDGGTYDFSEQIKIIINSMKKINNINGKHFLYIDNEMVDTVIPNSIKSLKENYSWTKNVESGCEFCHNDFHDENIIVKDDKIVSIIDWELGGYYPKNYEFEKYSYLQQYSRFSSFFKI